MAEITASAVKSLREKTGAGMMECKNALTEAGGNEEQAIEILRKRGLASAKKREGRIAAEGAVSETGTDEAAAEATSPTPETEAMAMQTSAPGNIGFGTTGQQPDSIGDHAQAGTGAPVNGATGAAPGGETVQSVTEEDKSAETVVAAS